MKILVGYTGFVGSNLAKQTEFDLLCNRTNISLAYDKRPELLVYAGVTGTKFIANKYPDKDKIVINQAIENIKKIHPKKLILISTVDIYDNLECKDEDYVSCKKNLHDYGKNRLFLEEWVKENVIDYHIIRLPALYGENLRKNYVQDLISPVPAYLLEKDYLEIEKEFINIKKYYNKKEELYTLNTKDQAITDYFLNSKYSSLRFTDSNSMYQYFDLKDLYKIIEVVIKNKINYFNCVTEPISSEHLYKVIYKGEFSNQISNSPIMYRLTTKFAYLFGKDKYIKNADEVILDLQEFINLRR